MKNEQALDKKTIIAELTKSAHGDLSTYLATGLRAAKEDPDFFGHLIAWNHLHGSVKDSQIALPIIALAALRAEGELSGPGVVCEEHIYAANALAHLADLPPQMLKRVFLETTRKEKPAAGTSVSALKRGKKLPEAKSVPVPPFMKTAGAPTRLLRRFVTRYLRDLETVPGRFEYVAVQHRYVLHELYAKFRVPCPEWVSRVLYDGVKGQPKAPVEHGVFGAIRRLHQMPIEEAAGTIVKYKIPFLVARGALGKKASEPDTVLALIKAMSPAELVTNMGWLEELGVKTNPALREALEQALGRAGDSKKSAKAVLKTSKAAEAVAGDTVLASKLHALQEKQLDKLGGIEGDWLVLGDRSGSMKASIEVAKEVAATLARQVKGHVYLVFFDTAPNFYDVTGKTLDEIKKLTRGITDGGGTSFRCGMQDVIDRKLHIDGIALISDGGENQPAGGFAYAYKQYAKLFDHEPTVFWYRVNGDYRQYAGYSLQREMDEFRRSCAAAHIDVQEYDLTGGVDFYSLPNLVQTMRVARFSLLDDVMNTPLRELDDVLTHTKGMAVFAKPQPVTA